MVSGSGGGGAATCTDVAASTHYRHRTEAIFGSFNCGEEERLLAVNFLASLAVGVVVAIASHSDPFPSSVKRAMPEKGPPANEGRAEIDRTAVEAVKNSARIDFFFNNELHFSF